MPSPRNATASKAADINHVCESYSLVKIIKKKKNTFVWLSWIAGAKKKAKAGCELCSSATNWYVS